MDFLILFSSRHRVVLEVDGKHHYANGDTASPALYSEMVSEDRRLRLAGYEVYRFGGTKLIVGNFFVPGSRPERSGAGKECIRMLSTCPPRVTGDALAVSSCPTTRCYWCCAGRLKLSDDQVLLVMLWPSQAVDDQVLLVMLWPSQAVRRPGVTGDALAVSSCPTTRCYW
jgi:hypothetical protein